MNGDPKKKTITLLLSLLAVVIIYNACLFALSGIRNHGPFFWISYVFMMIAFCVIACSIYLLKDRSMQPRDRVLGFPVIRHCIIFIIVEAIVSVIMMILDRYVPAQHWGIAFALHLIILTIHIILIVSCFVAKEKITQLNEDVKMNTAVMLMLRADTEFLAQQAAQTDAGAVAKKLADEIRYSDSVSHPALQVLEAQIGQEITMAKNCLLQNDTAACIKHCESALTVLSERNLKCALLK